MFKYESGYIERIGNGFLVRLEPTETAPDVYPNSEKYYAEDLEAVVGQLQDGLAQEVE